MGVFATLVYGWMAGIVAVVLCILYGFDTLLFIMRHLSRLLAQLCLGGGGELRHGRRHSGVLSAAASAMGRPLSARLAIAKMAKASLRDQGLEGIVVGSASETAPLKMSSVCSVSWWEDRTFGAPVRCRFVLVGHLLTIYELLPSAGGGGGDADGGYHDGTSGGAGTSSDRDGAAMAAAEHLRGRTMVDRLHPQLIKHLPKDKSRLNSPFTGKVLVVRTVDSQPLVSVSDGNDTASPAGTGGGGLAGGRSSSFGRSPGSRALSPSRSSANASLAGGLGGAGDPHVPGTTPNAHATHGTTGSRHGLSAWTSVIVKFRDARETERWHNVLRGVKEAEAWRAFAKGLPNPDTINTLLSRFFFQNMRGEGLANGIKKQIQKKLKKVSLTKFPRDLTGEILLDDFVTGSQIPWISDVSDPTISTNGEVGFDFNLHYKGGDEGFTLFFRLALAYRDIRIPHVVFSVKLHELEGTVHVSIGPPPSKKFWIAGHQPPVVRLEVHQGCASGRGLLHRILTSLPDLSGILTNLIKLYLHANMVLPYMDDFPMPNFDSTPKASPSALPKTRVFDRQRAAKKSAAPDLHFATPATSVSVRDASSGGISSRTTSNPNAEGGAQGGHKRGDGGDGVGSEDPPGYFAGAGSASMRSGQENRCDDGAHSSPLSPDHQDAPMGSVASGGYAHSSALRGGGGVAHASGVSPTFPSSHSGAAVAQPVWGSSNRRSALHANTLANAAGMSSSPSPGPLSWGGGSTHHGRLGAPPHHTSMAGSGDSPREMRASLAGTSGGFGAGGTESSGSELASGANGYGSSFLGDHSTTTATGDYSENPQRARKARAAHLRSALKEKGVDMYRRSVSRAANK